MNLRNLLFKASLVLVIGSGLLLFSSGSTSAVSMDVVAGSASGTDGDGSCQLVEALGNVGAQDQGYEDCPAGDGDDDTINLPAGTITQSANLPQIYRSVTIRGKGQGVSIVDGGGTSRMFHSDYIGLNFMMKFEDFSTRNVADGFGGGRCFYLMSGYNGDVNADIYLKNIEMDSCGPGGILVLTPVNVNTRGLSLYMDGVDMQGSGVGTPTYSTGVQARDLENFSMLNSTISGFDGGLYMITSKNAVSEYRVANNTISGNGTAVLAVVSTELNCGACGPTQLNLKIFNNTIYGNSIDEGDVSNITAGMRIGYFGGTGLSAEVKNNLIAGNYVGDTMSNCLVPGVQSMAYVSEGNMSDDDCGGVFSSSDFSNTSGISTTLGSLQMNSGEVRTMALLGGSPALDAGVTLASVLSDARGVARPQNVVYDIGAYEAVYDGDSVTEDPGELPGDGNSGGDVSSITPGVPRTGILAGLSIAGLAVLGILAIVVKEIVEKRSSSKNSEST